MPIQISSFPAAYLKIQRANIHIEEFRSLTEPVLHNTAYRIEWRDGGAVSGGIEIDTPISDPDFARRQLVYYPLVAISANLALVIGDVIHNLRTALDIAATTVVRNANGSTKFVTFPFHEKRENLVPEQSAGLAAIQKALPKTDCVQFFQHTIQPYKDGNFPLWALTKLDKIDKHNMLIPNVSFANIAVPDIHDIAPNAQAGNNLFGHNADKEMALYTGAARKNAKVQDNIEVAVKVTFPKGDLFGDEPVLPTLVNLSQVTTKALESFDHFVRG